MWPDWRNFTLDIFEVLPTVIIFDCDFTLWPFLFDYHAHAPFRTFENGTVLDDRNNRVSYYIGVPEMLKLLSERNIRIGLVNYTKKPGELKQILNALGWMKYISYLMLHTNGPPGQLVKDMIEKERIKYPEVLYFDELPYNLVRTERLGVISALAEWGMNPDSLENGLKEYVDRYKNPRTKSPEEIFDQATAGRVKKVATTPDATWSLSVTPSYNFISTTPKPT